jgi:hypothetical protein
MGERTLRKRRNPNLPTLLIRPSIIVGATKSPVPGWTDTISAAGGLSLIGGMGIINSAKTDDGEFPAKGGGGYGKRMLYDEGELFALNNKDNVLVTTNPIQANDMFSSGQYAMAMSPTSGNIMLASMMKKISERFDNMQSQGAIIQTSVNIDGQVAGQSLEVAKYKTSA